MPAPFIADQCVRLTSDYRGRPFCAANGTRWSPPEFVRLVAGTVLTIARCQERRAGRAFDGETVLAKHDRRTFCIPVRLLEVVPTERSLNHEPKESAGDAQGDRVA